MLVCPIPNIKTACKPINQFLFPIMLEWLWYLITAVHPSHCFRETDHALKLSHCNPPWRLGYSRTIPLAEAFILFHNEVLWLFRNLFQNISEVRAFLYLMGVALNIKFKSLPGEDTLGELRRSKLWNQWQEINTEMPFKRN